MRKVSKIFLLLSGILMIVALISTILSLILSWCILGINVGFNILLSVLIKTGGNQDVINGLMQFTTFTSPFKMLFSLLGLMGEETMTNDAIVTYLIVESFLDVVGVIIATISLIIPMIIALLSAIFALVGSGKKAKKGIHIMNIVFGALAYLYSNQMIGIFMVLGGVFANIADNKESKELEQKEENTEPQSFKLVEEYK